MNLREMLNEVLGQSGFLQKTSFAGSSDPDDIQMVSIANRVAVEIVNMYRWEALRDSVTINFTEVGGVPVTLYPLPANFHDLLPDSAWATDGSRKVDLPTKESEWWQIKNSSLSPGGVIRARLRNGIMMPWGPGGTVVPSKAIEIAEPTVGESMTFDYETQNAVYETSSSSSKPLFTEDTDTWILDDQTLILGIQAHWMQTKLMPQYREHMINYRQKLNESIGRDAGTQTIGGVSSGIANRRSPYYPLWRT